MKDYLDEINIDDLTPAQRKIAESIGMEGFNLDSRKRDDNIIGNPIK
ncbi:MAG: hypothetical protein IIT46_11425 [Lachnospiraceae bacterium]|nr:hypothetical protein [Lachnospiraceae bacterium]